MDLFNESGKTWPREGALLSSLIPEQESAVEEKNLLNPSRPDELSHEKSSCKVLHIPFCNIARSASTASGASRSRNSRIAKITPLKTLAYRVYVHSIQKSNSKRTKSDNASCKRHGFSTKKGAGIFQGGAPVRCEIDSSNTNSENRECVARIIPRTPMYPIYVQSLHEGQNKTEDSSRTPSLKSKICKGGETDKGIMIIGDARDRRPCKLNNSGTDNSQTYPNTLQNPAYFSPMHQNNGRVDCDSDGNSLTSKDHTDLKIESELNAKGKMPEHVVTKEISQGSEGLSEPPNTSQSLNGKFHCRYCDKTFQYKSQVEIHALTHTGVRPFHCNVCKKCFRSRSHLTVHYRSHSGEKPYVCKICGKAFTRNNNLNVHLCLHSGERHFQCHLCQKTFAQKTSLYSHMKTHSEIKPYRCKVCDKSFKKSSQIAPHMRVHTGDRPFSCSVCDQSFSQKAHLQVHMRRHNGEKPYECEVCHKTFRDRSQLKSHFRVHTGEKKYQCKLCTQAFRYLAQLTKHLKSLHADEMPVAGS